MVTRKILDVFPMPQRKCHKGSCAARNAYVFWYNQSEEQLPDFHRDAEPLSQPAAVVRNSDDVNSYDRLTSSLFSYYFRIGQ